MTHQNYPLVVFCPGCGAPGRYIDGTGGYSTGGVLNSGNDMPGRAKFRCGTVLENPRPYIWLDLLPHIPGTPARSWSCHRIAEWKRLVARLETAA